MIHRGAPLLKSRSGEEYQVGKNINLEEWEGRVWGSNIPPSPPFNTKLRKERGGLGLSLAWGLGVFACRPSEGPT